MDIASKHVDKTPSAATVNTNVDTDKSVSHSEETISQLNNSEKTVSLMAKWGKERIELKGLSPETTIWQVKTMLMEKTFVLPKRQKLIGLTLASKVGGGKVTDENFLSELKLKKSLGKRNIHGTKGDDDDVSIICHQFILMGTPEENIFIDPRERDDLPDVVDDFDLDFNAGSDEWLQHVANGENLRKFTAKTAIHVMNKPREKKPLLVLDLDHTLLDFSSRQLREATTHVAGDQVAAQLKRPFMDEFLTVTYRHFDLVVWSQTSWRWLETKLTELGMLTHPGYKICFVLDKTSMFSVTSQKRDGTKVKHQVKPLQIVWSKFPRWGPHNTVHLDDLSRNFALNLGSGLKVTAYHRKKSSSKRDMELHLLAKYLEQLALKSENFEAVEFKYWMDVVSGKRTLSKSDDEEKKS